MAVTALSWLHLLSFVGQFKFLWIAFLFDDRACSTLADLLRRPLSLSSTFLPKPLHLRGRGDFYAAGVRTLAQAVAVCRDLFNVLGVARGIVCPRPHFAHVANALLPRLCAGAYSLRTRCFL